MDSGFSKVRSRAFPVLRVSKPVFSPSGFVPFVEKNCSGPRGPFPQKTATPKGGQVAVFKFQLVNPHKNLTKKGK